MKGTDIKIHVDWLAEHSLKTLQNLKDNIEDELDKYLALSLDRLYKTTAGLSLLLASYDKNLQLSFSIAIIYRTALLDCVLTLHLYIINDEELSGLSHDESIARLNEVCKSYLADGIYRLIDIIKREKELGHMSKDELEESYNHYVKAYSDFFEDYKFDGSEPIRLIKKYYSPKKISKRIINSKKFKAFESVYGKYDLYSKFEHISSVYYDLARTPTNTINRWFHESTKHLILHSVMVHALMKEIDPKDMFLSNQFSNIDEYLKTFLDKYENI